MKQTLVLIGCALVAACNKPQVHEQNASIEQVAQAVNASGVANDIFLRAGEWRVTGKMLDMNIPGLPPQAQAEMKKVMGQQQDMTYQYCLTPKEAKHPGGKFFNGKAQNNCRYDHFTMGRGKIDAQMRCAESTGSMTMKIDGTYAPDSYSTNVAMDMEGGQQGAMSMKMSSEAHRIGECTPADQKLAEERAAGTKG